MERLNAPRVAGLIVDDFAARATIETASTLHAQHGAGIFIGLDADVEVALPTGARVRGRVVVTPPDVVHAAACPAPALGLLYDPERAPGLAAWTRQRGGPFVLDGRAGARLAAAVRAHRATLFTGATLDGLARETAAGLAAAAPGMRRDRRVDAVAEALRDRDADAGDRDAAVAATRLSPAHLRDLFARQVGLPMRRFRLWHRMLAGLADYAVHADCTRAAHDAGFADLAHFSRTCRRLLGYSPSVLRTG